MWLIEGGQTAWWAGVLLHRIIGEASLREKKEVALKIKMYANVLRLLCLASLPSQ